MKCILLLLIFFGLFQFVSFKWNVKSEFIPFIVFTAIGMIVFIAGLLNVMFEAVLLIVLFSFFSIFFVLSKEKRFKRLESIGMWYFLIWSIAFAIILRGQKLFLYDDFSHWALVAREMLLKNRLPNFTDELIIFQSYPTGSAGFIYFIGNIMGQSEGIMLYAQSLLYLSCAAPLFVFINKKKVNHYVIIILYSLYLFVSNYGMITLYVDTLLTCVALAVTAIMFDSYRNNRMEVAAVSLLLGNSFLIIIKNSGLLFALLTTILFIILKIKQNPRRTPILTSLAIVMPFTMKLFWDRHVALVFSPTIVSKHSTSIASYQDIFGSKTSEDVSAITRTLLNRSLNVKYLDVQLIYAIILFLAGLIVFKYITKKPYKKSILFFPESKLLLTVVLLYGTYQLGLWGMYMFSMPLKEALSLASYMRYNITMTAYIFGIFIIFYLIGDYGREKKYTFLPSAYTLFLLSTLCYSLYHLKSPLINVVSNSQYENSPRKTLLQAISGPERKNYDKLLVYVSSLTEQYSKDYLYFQFKYELRVKDFEIIDSDHFDQLIEIASLNNITLIVLKDDPLISQFLEHRGYEVSEGVINIKPGEYYD